LVPPLPAHAGGGDGAHGENHYVVNFWRRRWWSTWREPANALGTSPTLGALNVTPRIFIIKVKMSALGIITQQSHAFSSNDPNQSVATEY